MFHTTTCAVLTTAICLLPGAAIGAQGKPVTPAQDPEVKKVIEALVGREKALKSLRLTMATRGAYPSGLTFETRGTLRVLKRTHFHLRVESTFGTGQEVRSVVEKVITPEGVKSRQFGPVEEVYTEIDRDLLGDLETMQAALVAADKARSSTGAGLPGLLSKGGAAPLGSAMIVGLDRRFELSVAATPRTLDGIVCRVLAGAVRAVRRGSKPLAANGPGEDDAGARRAEVYLRPDGIPILMRQFDVSDRQVLELRIEALELDPPAVEAKSFVLEVPEGVVFQPVMEHPPSRAQIERLQGEYEALAEKWRAQFPLRGKRAPK